MIQPASPWRLGHVSSLTSPTSARPGRGVRGGRANPGSGGSGWATASANSQIRCGHRRLCQRVERYLIHLPESVERAFISFPKTKDGLPIVTSCDDTRAPLSEQLQEAQLSSRQVLVLIHQHVSR